MAGFEVKDSGKREQYDSGMVRDTQEGKPDYTLIDPVGLERVAIHLVKGAEKYGRDNWRKANSEAELTRFKSSALRHIFQWLRGDADEDHMAAVVFNLFAAEYVKGVLKNAQTNILEGGDIYWVRVENCSQPSYWYADYLGVTFKTIWDEREEMFYVPNGGTAKMGAWLLPQDVKRLSPNV